MKVLITGATGFIGAALAEYVVGLGHQTSLCDNNIRGIKDSLIEGLIKQGAHYYPYDLTKPDQVAKLSKDYDIVFHLAAINGTENFYTIPYDVMRVSIASTMNLLDHFKDSATKFIYSSSSETYAATLKNFRPDAIPTSEDIELCIDDIHNERFSYGGSKIACELLVSNFSKQYGLHYQIIRYHNIYGPRMGTKHVVPQFVKRLISCTGNFEIFGGSQTRAFCYISDAVVATWEVGILPQGGEIFHIGNDQEEIEIQKMATLLGNIGGKQLNIIEKGAPKGSVQRRCPDISKLREITGYKPQIDLEKGLKLTYDWYLKWFETYVEKDTL